MALSATFTANFSSFYDAVDKADAKLKTFGDGADKVGGRLNTLANQFSGQKVVQEATLMVKAVEEIGGVAKLTEKELARLGATTNEAVAKMQALGMDVPKNLQEIADKTKAVTKATTEATKATTEVTKASTDWKGALTTIAGPLTSLAGAVGIGFGVSQVISFGKAIIEDAGHIADLSSKIGVSAEAVQRFGFAAEQTGASMDTIGTSITKMNANLAGGSDSTKAALDQIGLQFSDIRAMRPEDAFTAIAQAIQGIPDPMLQAKVATELFGKAGADLLPAINQGLIDIGNTADVMSNHVVASMDAAGDALDKYWKKFKVGAAETTVSVLDFIEKVQPELVDASGNLIVYETAAQEQARHTAEAFADAMGSVAGALKHVKAPMADLGLATASSSEQMDRATKHLAALEAAQKKAADAAEAHREKIADLAASISGVGLAQKVKDLDEATKLAVKTWGAGVLQSKALVDQVLALGKAGAALTPTLQQIYDRNLAWATVTDKVHVAVSSLLADIPSVTKELTAFNAAVLKIPAVSSVTTGGNVLSGGPNVADRVNKFADAAAKEAQRRAEELDRAYDHLIGTLIRLGHTGGDAFSQIASATGEALAMMREAQKSGNSLAGAVGQWNSGEKGTAAANFAANAVEIYDAVKNFQSVAGASTSRGKNALSGAAQGAKIGTMILPGWGTAIGAGVGAIVGALNDGHKAVRKEIGQWAEAYGGFEKLHETMAKELGAQSESLWVQLTQTKDPKQNLEAMEKINKALEEAAKKTAAMAKALDDARGKIGPLQTALEKFGGVVPSYLRPAIEAMLKMKGIPDDLKDALAKFTKDPSWQTLEGKAKELGINLEGLGKKFSQAKLGDIGLGYVRDLHMFEDAGSDMQIVIEGMSDELSDLYTTAKKTGVKLPDTLKPYMQTLVEQGRLLDENGNKIDHLDDDAFVHIEDTGLDDVVKILEEIAQLLRDSLPKAAEDGAKGVQDAFAKHPVRIPVSYQYPDGGEDPGTGGPPRGPGRQPTPDAFVDWGAVPAGASSAPINITVVSTLDGREVARNQVRYIPGELNRAGV